MTFNSPIQSLLDRSMEAREFINDISYLPELEMVFAFISKNASSTLKTYFASVDASTQTIQANRNPHFRPNTGFFGVDDLGIEAMNLLLLDPSTPKAVVGRDPVHRVVSAYNSRVSTWLLEPYSPRGEANTWLGIRQKILGYINEQHAISAYSAFTTEITLPMFVDYLAATPDALLDRHFAPQTFMCGSDTIIYDLIGKVEQLELFICNLSDLLNRKLQPLNNLKLNASNRIPFEQEKLSRDVIRKIEERYANDFIFFGYEGI